LAFWSLVYEMRVSLIFPFLFLMARRLGTYGTLGAIALCTWLGVRDPSSGLTRLLGHQTVVTLEYIGIFLLGLLVARNLSSLETWYRGLGKFGRTGFGLVAFLLYFESHLLNQRWFWHFGDMLIAVGAAGGLLIVLCSKVAHTVLTHPIPAFLGRISYSLYLVHGTLLVGLYYAFHKRLTGMWFLALFFPLCALLAWGFYETVEAPFMRKSQQVGRSAKTPQTEVATVV
jgi:peptidoglycan/LPS O-acetylase OafA/YrhL